MRCKKPRATTAKAVWCAADWRGLAALSDDTMSNLKAEFGPVGRSLAARYFPGVRFPDSATDRLAALHQRGFVVHVMRTTAWVNYLYLTWALLKRGLPPIRAVVNLRRWFTRPWLKTAQRGDFDVRFTYARQHKGSALIFLRETAFGTAAGREAKNDPFPALVKMVRHSDRPVFLVPELFVWEKWNQKVKPGLIDFIFGSPEAPGFLHSVLAFLRNHKRAQFRVGEPIDLKAFIEAHPDDSDAVVARKVRGVLHHHLARETRAVFGPPHKPTERLLDEALRDRVAKKSIAEISANTGRSLASVHKEARRHLDAIAARLSPTVVAILAPLFHWVFNRIYDGVEVEEEGLERAMARASTAPLVLTPSHKSHIDYLVMSYVLWQRGYSVPLVAAGANLSFFPLGPIFRRAGAFFLRRSFKDDKVYTLAFRAYVKKLIHDGIHHEFFPEGGRSRSGKLLPPKLGLFSWQVDAVLEGARNDLYFVPVAIDYEKVVESSSHSAELKGGDKKPEDLKALLQAPKVLADKYGRIHLRFAEPISLVALATERGLNLNQPVSEEQKKGLVRALGHRVMFDISQVSTVTPQALVASVLLAHRKRGITATEVQERVAFLRDVLTDLKVPQSTQLKGAPSSPSTLGPISEAMAMFTAEKMVRVELAGELPVYQVDDERRSELSFYKNTIINVVAGRTIVANALLSISELTVAAVKERALFLSRLFKLEFMYRAGVGFDETFNETVAHLGKHLLIEVKDDKLVIAAEPFARPRLVFLAELLREYLESYWLAAVTVEALPPGGCDRKELIKRALERGKAAYLAGEIEASEAISRITLENAVQYLTEQGHLVEVQKMLTPVATRPVDFAAQIRAFLPKT